LVDLDSNPTKLIEIVEVGKQLSATFDNVLELAPFIGIKLIDLVVHNLLGG
jgi:high-affinity K+ transport system ATPase subunit B